MDRKEKRSGKGIGSDRQNLFGFRPRINVEPRFRCNVDSLV